VQWRHDQNNRLTKYVQCPSKSLACSAVFAELNKKTSFLSKSLACSLALPELTKKDVFPYQFGSGYAFSEDGGVACAGRCSPDSCIEQIPVLGEIGNKPSSHILSASRPRCHGGKANTENWNGRGSF
jgi:hypothetical protein